VVIHLTGKQKTNEPNYHLTMNDRVRQNWQKVKKALEDSNKTDCYLYTRACEIVKSGRDPMESFFYRPL
jgi:hypothetical protein